MARIRAWIGKQNKYFLAGLLMTGLVLLLAVLSLFWTPYSTTAMSPAERFAAPSFRHLFGTDNFGRDIFSRVMKGIGMTVVISSLIVLFSGTISRFADTRVGFVIFSLLSSFLCKSLRTKPSLISIILSLNS